MNRLTYREKGDLKINCNPIHVIEKLEKYEDAEENGKLLRLPCKIGAVVYVLAECENIPTVLDGGLVNSTGYYCPYELNDKCPHRDIDGCDEVADTLAVFEDTISCMQYDETGLTLFTDLTRVSGTIGEYIFLTREEAEKALAERG